MRCGLLERMAITLEETLCVFEDAPVNIEEAWVPPQGERAEHLDLLNPDLLEQSVISTVEQRVERLSYVS